VKRNRSRIGGTACKHNEDGVRVSWALLHPLSLYIRVAALLLILGPAFGLGIGAFIFDMTLEEALARASEVTIPRWLLVVAASTAVLGVFDATIRNSLIVDADEVVFVRPWGSRRSWPRRSLTAVRVEKFLNYEAERALYYMGVVYLTVGAPDHREQVAVGGWLFEAGAEKLADQLKPYTH
jgi:hypothetical protein